ncbi:NADPH oxidase 5 [Parus major]|uniref:NADPH oxidase 5 n=1 Tax=Parus major TaxID=9157 RepID=UPI001443F777|nr:NADPH oxidase 5 [Parus major]
MAAAADADAEWLRWVSERFGNSAGKEPEIGLEEFTRTLGIKESFFAERFFALFDSDGSGSLSREELLGSLRRLLRGNSTEKLLFLFQVYDVDGSGSIDGQELLQVLRGCLRESSLALPEERLRALSQALLCACDRDRSGSISFPELREQLEAFPELLESLSISAASWLKPPSPAERRLCCFSWESCREQRAGLRRFSRECGGPGGFSRECWRAGMRRVSREWRWPGLWLAGSALLLALGALRHRERGPGTALARGCGAALNLNCALLPVSDTGDTAGTPGGHWGQTGDMGTAWGHGDSLPEPQLRPAPGERHRGHRGDTGGTPGGHWGQTGDMGTACLNLNCALLPVSDTGGTLGGQTGDSEGTAGGQTVGHGGDTESTWGHTKGTLKDTVPCTCSSLSPSLEQPGTAAGVGIGTGGDRGPFQGKSQRFQDSLGLPFPTGIPRQPQQEAPVGSSTSHSHPCSHSHPHPHSHSRSLSQVFYWTHLSYIPVWFLLLLHAPHFWKWFLIPGSLFFLEKVLGWLWRRAGDLHILEARLLPSKVTHLVIQRPESFRFQPGDFVFLNIPAIAAYEWHPFSISSAPEQPGTLWLHIRARGQWTNKLYEHFQRLESHGPEPDPSGRCSGKGSGIWDPALSWHGEPRSVPQTRELWDRGWIWCQDLVPGSGLGSCAGIRCWDLESGFDAGIQCRDPVLGSGACPSRGFPALSQVDFVWITRDQQHLQWFLSLLAQLEAQQAELEPGGKFLELHLFMTSALGKGDVKALGLQLALDLLAAQEKRDSISGLRSRTQPGHPDWAKLFGKVAAERRGKVRVFFCGSAGLARIIRRHCRSFGFAFSKENF